MALSTGASIADYAGWTELTDGSNSAVTNGSTSVAADLGSTFTNSENAEIAGFVLTCAFSVAPTVNSPISLYARLMNIDSTNDQPLPDATYNGIYVGAFTMDAVTASTSYPLVGAPLPSVQTSQVVEFYIVNGTGQTISANWRLYINPKGYITKA